MNQLTHFNINLLKNIIQPNLLKITVWQNGHGPQVPVESHKLEDCIRTIISTN